MCIRDRFYAVSAISVAVSITFCGVSAVWVAVSIAFYGVSAIWVAFCHSTREQESQAASQDQPVHNPDSQADRQAASHDSQTQ